MLRKVIAPTSAGDNDSPSFVLCGFLLILLNKVRNFLLTCFNIFYPRNAYYIKIFVLVTTRDPIAIFCETFSHFFAILLHSFHGLW